MRRQLMPHDSRQRATTLVLLALLLAAAQPESTCAAPLIRLGPADSLAFDQPRVAVEVIREQTGQPPVSLGPDLNSTFLLDTGSTSILAGDAASDEMTARGLVTEADYLEQGVGGFSLTRVSAPYRVDFAGDDGQRQTLSQVRLLTSDLNFGGFSGIVGMPAMVERITSLDLTVWLNGLATLPVAFPAVPPVGAHQYSVPLTLVDFPLTGQVNPNDPLPVAAPLPFAPVETSFRGQRVASQFLVDTGAQISILSTATAFALGLDRNGNGSLDDEKVGDLPFGGVGGEVTMPLLEIDTLAVRSDQGVDLVWDTLTVGVLDIDASIPGVLGMDLVTSGWLERALVGTGEPGLYQVYFDFRAAAQRSGQMILAVNPALDVVVPEPAALSMAAWGLGLAVAAAGWFRRRRESLASLAGFSKKIACVRACSGYYKG